MTFATPAGRVISRAIETVPLTGQEGPEKLPKRIHEIRDPIHVFVRLNTDEREVLDSRPFQRLRDVHQLGLTYLLYPGATHKRFEHSLGVMELATRIFNVVTNRDNVSAQIRRLLPEITRRTDLKYWRSTIRMAALCHDVGHLPFSHAAEKELLPKGWDHERLTEDIIISTGMRSFWDSMELEAEVIAKLAVGPKKSRWREKFSTWEAILAEIIVGDAFGADRIDYLLRDSLHTGVAYGRFDHHRLVDTLRILPSPQSDSAGAEPKPELGMQHGGVHTAEALLLARFFMYTQMYMHPVRLIYDIHLMEFLREWLPNGAFPTGIEEHMSISDSTVMMGLREADAHGEASAHDPAMRIIRHKHFKRFYERHPDDGGLDPGLRIFRAAKQRFEPKNVRRSHDRPESPVGPVFPVQIDEEGKETYPSVTCSKLLANPPMASVDFVYVLPKREAEARKWLRENRRRIVPAEEVSNE